jgi:hypothetical protein
VIAFERARFVEDVAVDGKVIWHRAGAAVYGRLTVHSPGASGRLSIRFDTDRRSDVTTIVGVLGGHPVELTMGRLWSS